MSSPGVPPQAPIQPLPYTGTVPPPLSDEPESRSSAFWNQVGTDAGYGNLGAEYVSRAVGATAYGGDPRNVQVPADRARKFFTDEKLDPAAVPESGWSVGSIAMEMNRQKAVAEAQYRTQRAGVSSTGQFIAGLMGGAADPINLALGPIAGRVLGGIKVGVVARAAMGAAEGGAFVGAYEAAQKHLEGHDPDIASWSTVRDIAIGGLMGAGAHAVFGARPEVTTDTIASLEGSAAASKASGVPIDQVESRTGALGVHQVEPTTAMQMGFGKTLDEARELMKDPAQNKAASQAYLNYLSKKFPGDPEAVTVAYNGGPGRAEEWIKAGRDVSALPKETQGYLARYRDMNGGPVNPATVGAKFGQMLPGFNALGNAESQRVLPLEWAKTVSENPPAVLPEYQHAFGFESQPELLGVTKPRTLEPSTEGLSQGELPEAEKLPSQRGLPFGEAPEKSLLDRQIKRLMLGAAQVRADAPVAIEALDRQLGMEFVGSHDQGAQLSMDLQSAGRRFVDPFDKMRQGEAALDQQPRQLSMGFEPPQPTQLNLSGAKQGDLWAGLQDGFRGSQPSLFDAVPKPNAIFSRPEEVAPPEPIKTPEQIHADATSWASQQLGAEATARALENVDTGTTIKHQDMTKAIQAAVQCAMRKGISLVK